MDKQISFLIDLSWCFYAFFCLFGCFLLNFFYAEFLKLNLCLWNFSWPWPTQVITWILEWILIMPGILCLTVEFGSPNMEIEKFITCTCEKKVHLDCILLFCSVSPVCKLNPHQEWFPGNFFILSFFTASWLLCNDIYFEHSFIIRVNEFLRKFNFSCHIVFKVTKLIKLVHMQVRLEWDE